MDIFDMFAGAKIHTSLVPTCLVLDFPQTKTNIMAFNLLDSVNGLFSNDLINSTASAFGENGDNIQKALNGAIPSVLTGFLDKAGSSAGAQSLLDMGKQASSSGILSNLGSLLSGSGSSSGLKGMVSSLFGDKLGNVSSLISGFSGIKATSASSLLSMVAPAALGSLGKYATQYNLGASGITSFLASQKDNILSAIPSGLNLAGALGLGNLSGIGSTLSSAFSDAKDADVHAAHTAHTEIEKKTNWLLPFILAILAFALLLYLFKSCGSTPEPAAVVDSEIHNVAGAAPEIMEPARESIKVQLPDNTELDAYKAGIEDMLVSYLKSDEPISKEKWFDFDDLNFETGSATITGESAKQVQNIAAILKAFPKAKIKIGGYTDNTGDSAANVKLSQARADAVLAALKGAGANAGQLDSAEGYGPTHFVAPNDTEENMKKNRRISINVKEK
ncbi:MAG TPA: OmpA family protein [Agriterribacter sp.]|nr:OmpA family protein [Agriterribacter sp.]